MTGRDAPRDEDAPDTARPWLLVIDPQNIFASPDSAWGSPFFPDALAHIVRLAEAADSRVLVTRWLPTADRATSWGDYFAAWPFADRPADDPLYDLVPAARALSPHPTLDLPTFGKWGPELERITGGAPVVVTGVSTDCCVISTVLAGADAGGRITVVPEACAGSTAENHDAAIRVLGLYPPQVALASADTAAMMLSGTAAREESAP
ncbi:cysteine hydrolase [Microbacterium resistens]|uniref:cysteine hydrolase family protein n=1 Tax=Microbacterium resistens TaxID=156977 RepID=UPI001C56B9F2|nr:cysteine hydrolase [Microbacterium resistens]MBW1640965.1 cysteine hydrolase [Microbacterium resistens]